MFRIQQSESAALAPSQVPAPQPAPQLLQVAANAYRMFSNGVKSNLATRYFPGLYLQDCIIEEVSLYMVRKNPEDEPLELKLGDTTIFTTSANKIHSLNMPIGQTTIILFELVGKHQPLESSLTLKIRSV